MTVYRAYSAEMYSAGPIILIITYNLYGRKIKESHFISRQAADDYLAELKEIEPRFTFENYLDLV